MQMHTALESAAKTPDQQFPARPVYPTSANLQDADTQVQYWKVLLCDERRYPPGSWSPGPKEEVCCFCMAWLAFGKHPRWCCGCLRFELSSTRSVPMRSACDRCQWIWMFLVVQEDRAGGKVWHPLWPKFRNLAVR